MNKKYVYILFTFVAMQLSTYIGGPLLFLIGTTVFGIDPHEMEVLAIGYWLVFSFATGLLITLLLLRKNEKYTTIEKSVPLPLPQSIVWAVGGIFLAFVAQIIAVLIETSIGIEPGSENTEEIIQLIELFPLLIIVSSILGPIIEEIVFRKVLFGMLYNRFSFIVAALISSLLFALAHFDFTHLILYTAMGIVFSYLYVRTKRIIVPIIAHVMMNTIVVVLQSFADQLETHTTGMIHILYRIGGFFL